MVLPLLRLRYAHAGMVPQFTALVVVFTLTIGCQRRSVRTAPIRIVGVPLAQERDNTTNPTPPLAPEPRSRLPVNWPYSHPEVVTGPTGMVVTDNAIGTEVGRHVLAEGGNAADAAVATAASAALPRWPRHLHWRLPIRLPATWVAVVSL